CHSRLLCAGARASRPASRAPAPPARSPVDGTNGRSRGRAARLGATIAYFSGRGGRARGSVGDRRRPLPRDCLRVWRVHRPLRTPRSRRTKVDYCACRSGSMVATRYIVFGGRILLLLPLLCGCGGSTNESPGRTGFAGAAGISNADTTPSGGALAAGGVAAGGMGGTGAMDSGASGLGGAAANDGAAKGGATGQGGSSEKGGATGQGGSSGKGGATGQGGVTGMGGSAGSGLPAGGSSSAGAAGTPTDSCWG